LALDFQVAPQKNDAEAEDAQQLRKAEHDEAEQNEGSVILHVLYVDVLLDVAEEIRDKR
jgi:hypothetical protein